MLQAPLGSKGRRIHLQGNIIIRDLAWDLLSRIVCTQSRGNFFPPMHAAQAERKKRIWFGPGWCCRVIYQPNASSPLGFGVNISRLFHSEVLASWHWKKRLGLKEARTQLRKWASLYIFHKYDESIHAVQHNLLSRTSELLSYWTCTLLIHYSAPASRYLGAEWMNSKFFKSWKRQVLKEICSYIKQINTAVIYHVQWWFYSI